MLEQAAQEREVDHRLLQPVGIVRDADMSLSAPITAPMSSWAIPTHQVAQNVVLVADASREPEP